MRTATAERLSVLAELRALVPPWPLHFAEAKRICERQADRLRELTGVRSAELPVDVIPSLPRIEVETCADITTSGFSYWHDGCWRLVVNAREPWQRQRFSLGHELWHVINHQTISSLLPSESFRALNAERLADYFSGCLHLPADALRLYAEAGYDPDDLANHFGVSVRAVAVRLAQLGLRTGSTV